MIRLSPEAERQLDELALHYAERGRDEAIDNLAGAVERACERYAEGRGSFYDAPRPYPTVRQPGWRWTKEGRYWLAFTADAHGPIVAAIFFETADLPRRI